MAENTIQSIGSSEGDSRTTVMYQLVQDQLFRTAETALTAQSQKAEKVNKAIAPKTDDKPAQSLLPITSWDTFLKFVVDEKTNDVTVYVVDRATQRIKRSIPPNEVNNLKAGDLLKLLA